MEEEERPKSEKPRSYRIPTRKPQLTLVREELERVNRKIEVLTDLLRKALL